VELKVVRFMDQELIPYRYTHHRHLVVVELVVVGDALSKKTPMALTFQIESG